MWGQRDTFNAFIQQEHIQLIRSDSKDIYDVTTGVYFK